MSRPFVPRGLSSFYCTDTGVIGRNNQLGPLAAFVPASRTSPLFAGPAAGRIADPSVRSNMGGFWDLAHTAMSLCVAGYQRACSGLR